MSKWLISIVCGSYNPHLRSETKAGAVTATAPFLLVIVMRRDDEECWSLMPIHRRVGSNYRLAILVNNELCRYRQLVFFQVLKELFVPRRL